METYQVNQNGYYGEFGGAYVPEILHRCVEELRINYRKVIDDPSFQQEFHQLLKDYVGRPSPLYLAKRLSELYGCKIYLKREDLNHTGAHKINNAIGQILLADGKKPYYCRNRCRTTRSRYSNRLCSDESGMCCLYGEN